MKNKLETHDPRSNLNMLLEYIFCQLICSTHQWLCTPVTMHCAMLCFTVFLPVVFIYILQGYFTGTGAIVWLPVWLPQCQWSNPEKYEQILQQNPQKNDNTTKTNRSTAKPCAWSMGYNICEQQLKYLQTTDRKRHHKQYLMIWMSIG